MTETVKGSPENPELTSPGEPCCNDTSGTEPQLCPEYQITQQCILLLTQITGVLDRIHQSVKVIANLAMTIKGQNDEPETEPAEPQDVSA